MALSTQPYKGARDFYPEDKRLQKHLFSVMRRVVERFGYEEYDGPVLEPLELYAAKTSEEVVNEQTYAFEDRGGRQVTIRPEMTPTVSRMVAGRRQELAYPLRWYSIPNLWRYERPQRGRLREHWQLNVDLFGVEGLAGDIEIIQVADAIMKTFGATNDMYEIRVNSSAALAELFESKGFDKQLAPKFITALDRVEKMSPDDFSAYLSERFGDDIKDKLLNFVDTVDGNDILATTEGKRLSEVIQALQGMNVPVVPDVGLKRGFEYYTGIIFEVFDKDPENNRSLFGGGRYDGLVGQFGVEPVPTVGFGMGDVTLQNFLETHSLLPKLPHETHVGAILLGDVYVRAQAALGQLRDFGLNVSVDSSGRKLDKQIKAADKRGLDYVLFIGEAELDSGEFTLKNLRSGDEQKLKLDEIARVLLNIS